MGIDFTSTALVESIRRRAELPDSQQLYDDEAISKIATEELLSDTVPLLMGLREEYLVHYYDQSIDTSVSSYSIPSRAIGSKLRDVVLLNQESREVGIPRLSPDFLKRVWWNGARAPYMRQPGFFFKDDEVILFPDTQNLGQFQLRMKYFRRPNNIVLVSAAGQITAINSGTKEVTLNNVPADWAITTLFDVIQGEPTFRSWGDDESITAINSTTKVLTFSELPTGMSVGDWVAPAGTSPIIQIPYEVHNLLAQRVAMKILEGLGDSNGLKAASEVYKDMLDKFVTLVTPRADGSPQKIVSSNVLWGGSGVENNGHLGPGWW